MRTLADFESLLKRVIGLDSVSVGKSSIERSLRLRMDTVGAKDVEDYMQYLQSSNDELQELIETVVVPETWFFRDPDAFTTLARLAVNEWRPAHPNAAIRLLSLPCSTGEEPYSMVMTLLDAGFCPDDLQVDAVDISARALARAKQGVYGANSFRGRNTAFRERYFRSVRDGYALPDWFSCRVNFRRGNLLSADFGFDGEPYDVIFCRNLLIYFDRPMQEQVIRKLASLLTPGGFLFVGPAEAFLASCHGFTPVNQAMSFAFRRRPAVQAPVARISLPVKPKRARPDPRPRDGAPGKVYFSPVSVPPADLGAARLLADAGQLHEAAASCKSHLQRHGPSAEAYYLLGLVHGALGDPDNATENYRKALYLEPDHAEALTHLAVLAEAQGDFAGAKRFFERSRRAERRTGLL